MSQGISSQTLTPVVLASRSPRRAELLAEVGVALTVCPSPFEDPAQPEPVSGVPAESLAMQLAFQKAQALIDAWQAGAADTGPAPAGRCVILGADSVCVGDAGELIGTPRDRAEAEAMLRGFFGRTHRVVTGVAMIAFDPAPVPLQPPRTWRFADAAAVRMGQISAAQLAAHLDAAAWQGKAGGYNLFAAQAAGWPVSVAGDPTTVVGLPMRRLLPELRAWGCLPSPASPPHGTFHCRG